MLQWPLGHVSFQIMVFSGYIPRSGSAESYGSSIFSFLQKLHTVFHSGCINLHSYQQCKRVHFSPHPLQHLLLIDFWIAAILTGSYFFKVNVIMHILWSLCRTSVLYKWNWTSGFAKTCHPAPESLMNLSLSSPLGSCLGRFLPVCSLPISWAMLAGYSPLRRPNR